MRRARKTLRPIFLVAMLSGLAVSLGRRRDSRIALGPSWTRSSEMIRVR